MDAQLRTALNATLQTAFGSRWYGAALWCAAWAEAYLSSNVVDDVSVAVTTIVTASQKRSWLAEISWSSDSVATSDVARIWP